MKGDGTEGAQTAVDSSEQELAGQAGGQALQWVSSQLLRAIGLGGGPGELDEIRLALERIEGPRRKSFRFVMSIHGQPALAAVNSPIPRCAYLYWNSQSNNVCYLVPNLADAVEIDVIRQ